MRKVWEPGRPFPMRAMVTVFVDATIVRAHQQAAGVGHRR
jgi:hypothetical protein